MSSQKPYGKRVKFSVEDNNRPAVGGYSDSSDEEDNDNGPRYGAMAKADPNEDKAEDSSGDEEELVNNDNDGCLENAAEAGGVVSSNAQQGSSIGAGKNRGPTMALGRFFGGGTSQQLQCVADVPPPGERVRIQRWSQSPERSISPDINPGMGGFRQEVLDQERRKEYEKFIKLYDSQWIRARHKEPIGRRPVQIETSGWLMPRHKLSHEPLPGIAKSSQVVRLRRTATRRHQGNQDENQDESASESEAPENARDSDSSDSAVSDSNDVYN